MAHFILAGLGLYLIRKRKKVEPEIVLPSAPPSSESSIRYFSGSIVDGKFYFIHSLLTLNDIRIVHIHVAAEDKSKVIHGKVIITSGENEVFKGSLNNGWIKLDRLLLVNATLKLETKSTKSCVYTIFYEAT